MQIPTQVNYRRGTAAQVAVFTPSTGEIVVDLTNSRIVVGDAVTVGGFTGAKLTDVTTAVSNLSGYINSITGTIGGNPAGLNALSGNLYSTGSILYNDIIGLSGFLTGKYLTGLIAGANITVNNNHDGTFTVSGNAGGVAPIITGTSGSYIFSNISTSGVSQEFILFPAALGANPYVITTLNNQITNELLFVQTSGIVSSGFWARYSAPIDSTGYLLTTIASISTTTGLATTVINNTTIQTGVSNTLLSGNLFTTGSNLYNLITGFSGVFNTTGTLVQNQINTLNSNYTSLSGNLITTGQTLYNDITGLSGVLSGLFARVVYTTGNQTITGIKTFNLPIVGNITDGGMSLVSASSFSIFNTDSVSVPSINWATYKLIDPINIVSGYSLNWTARTLNNQQGGTTLDWQNRILSGNWNAQALSVSGFPVITTGMTGGFGGGGTNTVFTGNSGSYIFSLFAISGSTSQFIKFPTNLGPNPYVISCLNNISGTENIFIQTSGIVNSGFWVNYSNPIDNSGYLITTFASLSTQSGLATTFIVQNINSVSSSDIVYTSGQQTISGIKYFNIIGVTGKISGSALIYDANNLLSIDFNGRDLYHLDSTSAIDYQNNQLLNSAGTVVDWSNCVLNDINSPPQLSIWWKNRQLYDSAVNLSLNWQNRALDGVWSADSFNISGNKVLTGLVAGSNITVNNNANGTFTINGNAGGGGGFVTGVSGSCIFSSIPISGATTQFITFPANLGPNPYVMCQLSNRSGVENILSQASGIVSSGYWANYSNAIDGSGYTLTTIAAISTQTGLATTVIINNSNTNTNTNTLWSGLTWGVTTNWTTYSGSIEDKAILILTGNTTLSINSLYNGWCGVLETVQSGISTTGYTLTLPASTRVINGGSGIAGLTMVSGAIDMLGFSYDGTKLFLAVGNNFN